MHLVYQSLLLAGKPVKLHAFTSKMYYQEMEGEDIALVSLIYPNGKLGEIMQAWTAPDNSDESGITIVGDKGYITIKDGLYLNGDAIEKDADYKNSFYHTEKAFAECILNNKEPISTMKDAADSMRIISLAYKAAAENQVVTVN